MVNKGKYKRFVNDQNGTSWIRRHILSNTQQKPYFYCIFMEIKVSILGEKKGVLLGSLYFTKYT